MKSLSAGEFARVEAIVMHIHDNDGEQSWFDEHIDKHFIWEETIQEALKGLGYEIKITPAQAYCNHGNLEEIPAMITIKSPYLIKKESIINKMKKEFGN